MAEELGTAMSSRQLHVRLDDLEQRQRDPRPEIVTRCAQGDSPVNQLRIEMDTRFGRLAALM